MANQDAQNDDSNERFIPVGAVAFFVALLILALIIWFGFYYIMIIRA